jgi:hypothetical protein
MKIRAAVVLATLTAGVVRAEPAAELPLDV